MEIGLHTQFIGELVDIKAEESVLDEQGMADIVKVKPLIFDSGQDAHNGIGERIGNAFSTGKGRRSSRDKSCH